MKELRGIYSQEIIPSSFWKEAKLTTTVSFADAVIHLEETPVQLFASECVCAIFWFLA